jgi:hypothetical protein
MTAEDERRLNLMADSTNHWRGLTADQKAVQAALAEITRLREVVAAHERTLKLFADEMAWSWDESDACWRWEATKEAPKRIARAALALGKGEVECPTGE